MYAMSVMTLQSRKEIRSISQSVTSSGCAEPLKYAKRVFAFTDYGMAMLSSVLRSPRAIQVNIAIMRAFSRLREPAAEHADLTRRLDELEKKYDARFKAVFDALRHLMAPPEKERKPNGFGVRKDVSPPVVLLGNSK